MKQGPRFLGIGAQKAGTTWLWQNMRSHPGVWMPLVKELHWFDTQYAAGDDHYKHRQGLARYRPIVREPTWSNIFWLWRFYRALESRSGYRALFQRSDGQLPGEITPAYAILGADAVKKVHEQLPEDCRIIFCMREPVDRLWSAIRMYCRKRNISLSDLTEADIDAIARQPAHALRSDYGRTLDHWSVFGSRLGLFFYEDMRSEPAQFLQEIFRFLGVDPSWKAPRLHHISNPGGRRSPAPPRSLAERWFARYAPVVSAVKGTAGRVPQNWESGSWQ